MILGITSNVMLGGVPCGVGDKTWVGFIQVTIYTLLLILPPELQLSFFNIGV